jgi:Cu+-exporting ATPase
MAKEKDPVCGMMVDTKEAAAEFSYGGTEYYFCSTQCRDTFVADPETYVGLPTQVKDEPEAHFTMVGSGEPGTVTK